MLGDNIKQNVGISAVIDVTPVGAVDRSAGKAVRIIDRRGD
jgi:phenylacetate-coenzyme A ligase PaaK-like adenylate-forming protein